MSKFPTSLSIGNFLLLLTAAGVAIGNSAMQPKLSERKHSTSRLAEVMVTIVLPENHDVPAGVVIITLEDVSVQDVQAVELASMTYTVSEAIDAQYTLAIPIDLESVLPDASVNVAVHIDTDNNSLLSDGDWISDSIVNVINNGEMNPVVNVVSIR